jgi:rhodanese-related sulfurtransferase
MNQTTPPTSSKSSLCLSDYAISANELFEAIINDLNLTILDVRTKEEYQSVHIDNALWIPLAELPDRLCELDPARNIVVYCHSDNRSKHAATFLLNAHFKSIKYLIGGITAWISMTRTRLDPG